jgi:hypothetical protein
MYLTTIDEVKNYSNAFSDEDNEEPLLNEISNQEIINILEEKLTDSYRSIYLRLKHGSKVSKTEKTKLFNKIKEIIGDKTDE